ncbi:MAG: ABC transporter substrate-binding protein [Candidatus Competibacter sp.]|nr:ABC transporter substrate-binding protein [Candidatus Competibacteraceae bacterium]
MKKNDNALQKQGKTARGSVRFALCGLSLALLTALAAAPAVQAQEPGVTPTTIRVGSVLDLEGESKMRGRAIKAGLETALKNEKVQGHAIEYLALNDSFNPKTAVEATQQLVDQGAFAMLGNTGGPSVKAALPLLAENKIPAVGFPIGVDFLRNGKGDIINLRASFAQEAALVLDAALNSGVKPQEICAYLPNDAGGISNLKALAKILAKQPNMADTVSKLEQVIAMPGEEPNRNGVGPVGFFTRHTQMQARPGYDSLKQWEKTANTRCKLVMTVGGTNLPLANFISYSRYKGETWPISVTSQVEVTTFKDDLKKNRVLDRIVLTQAVPALDSSLPIVEEARKALGDRFDSSSLEGYMVGKMFVTILRNVKGEITRASFLDAARGRSFDLGGLPLDFTNDNQGSDFVQLLALEDGAFKPKTSQQLQQLFKK